MVTYWFCSSGAWAPSTYHPPWLFPPEQQVAPSGGRKGLSREKGEGESTPSKKTRTDGAMRAVGGSGTSRQAIIPTGILLHRQAKAKAKEGITHHLSERVALDGQPWSVVEPGVFHCLPHYGASGYSIPSWRTFGQHVMTLSTALCWRWLRISCPQHEGRPVEQSELCLSLPHCPLLATV